MISSKTIRNQFCYTKIVDETANSVAVPISKHGFPLNFQQIPRHRWLHGLELFGITLGHFHGNRPNAIKGITLCRCESSVHPVVWISGARLRLAGHTPPSETDRSVIEFFETNEFKLISDLSFSDGGVDPFLKGIFSQISTWQRWFYLSKFLIQVRNSP